MVPVRPASLPLCIYKAVLSCLLISTGLTCFPLCRAANTYSSCAWPFSTSLHISCLVLPPLLFSPLIPSLWNNLTLCRPNKALCFPGARAHAVVRPPHWLHHQSLNWTSDSSYPLNAAAFLRAPAETTRTRLNTVLFVIHFTARLHLPTSVDDTNTRV